MVRWGAEKLIDRKFSRTWNLCYIHGRFIARKCYLRNIRCNTARVRVSQPHGQRLCKFIARIISLIRCNGSLIPRPPPFVFTMIHGWRRMVFRSCALLWMQKESKSGGGLGTRLLQWYICEYFGLQKIRILWYMIFELRMMFLSGQSVDL